jgi:TRAP-type C4-dicarboxylate transport system substrate-binding protein
MKWRCAVLVALAVVLLALPAGALAQQKVLRYAHFQPARPDQPKHAAALAFKEHVEKATNGSIKVEIFPAGQFGNDADTMSGLRLGTLDMAVAHDGAIAVIYKPVGVLGIPFLYENHEHAWRVYDSSWLKEFSDDMIKKSGVRLLSFADNGVRHFTNSKRPIHTPAIPWAELPTALQQKVVDGQENGVTNILAASLYQYQKYITLDGHVWSVHGYTINEKYYQGLSAVERKAVEEGTQKATAIHRKMTSDQDKNAKEILGKLGMEVTEITPAELAQFRKLAQPPVKAWAEKEIGKEYVDSLFKAIEATR